MRSIFISIFLILFLHILLVTCIPPISTTTSSSPVNAGVVSSNHPVESHHSLHAPLDKSQVYWNYGGSTVVSKNLIRLTPSTQDRRGWLWFD
jgi:hypothetical protein